MANVAAMRDLCRRAILTRIDGGVVGNVRNVGGR